MQKLRDILPGTWIVFPEKRRRYQVVSHYQTFLEIRPGFDYPDGRNFDTHPGTELKNTSGKKFIVKSSREVSIAKINQLH